MFGVEVLSLIWKREPEHALRVMHSENKLTEKHVDICQFASTVYIRFIYNARVSGDHKFHASPRVEPAKKFF